MSWCVHTAPIAYFVSNDCLGLRACVLSGVYVCVCEWAGERASDCVYVTNEIYLRLLNVFVEKILYINSETF